MNNYPVRTRNTMIFQQVDDDDEENYGYKVNSGGQDCCICLESKYRIYKCVKCNDGLVCVKCFKENCHIKNFTYPTGRCRFDNDNIMLLTYKCPICRDFRGEDLNEDTRKKYEFTKDDLLDKILTFNENNINEYHHTSILEEPPLRRMIEDGLTDDEYNSEWSNSEDDEDDEENYSIHLEDWINDSLMEDLPSIHGLTGEHRARQARRQEREIDVINNIYTLNLLFDEHFNLDDN